MPKILLRTPIVSSLGPAVVVLLLAACGPSGPDERIVAGRIDEIDLGPQTLLVPDTVRVSAPFFVTITTVGGGCIRKAAPTRIEAASPLVRVLRPFDVESLTRGSACTSDLLFLPRVEELVFHQAGQATVQVTGPGGRSGITITIERTITVR